MSKLTIFDSISRTVHRSFVFQGADPSGQAYDRLALS